MHLRIVFIRPTFDLIKQLGQHHLHPIYPMRSSNLGPEKQRIRSKSLDSQTSIHFGKFYNVLQRYLFLHKRFLSVQRNLHTRTIDTKPKNVLTKARWKSTGQLSISI